jgi:glutathione peroxidase
MRLLRRLALLFAPLAVLPALAADQAAAPAPAPTGPLSFTMNNLAGQPVDLATYRGKVVLLVNVASKCGLTKQYKELQALHDKYSAQGLAIVGVPANNFGGQEPGTAEQIQQFCSATYGVKFDLLAKVSVKGDDICPLYAYLTDRKTNPQFAGEIMWNFTKFLISRQGQVIGRFGPRTAPDATEVVAAIEQALAAQP